MTEKISSIDEAAAEADGGKKDSSERLAAARKKFGDAVDGVTRKAHGASERAREGAGRATAAAKETYDAAGDNIREGYERVSKDLETLGQDVNEYVRHNPGKAIAIAAGVGFFVGILMRGRRD